MVGNDNATVVTAACRGYPLRRTPIGDFEVIDRDHPAPGPECECGVWALRDEYELIRKFGGDLASPEYVFGTVELWGRIIEHTGGYRAEHARPRTLYVAGDDLLRRRVRAAYGRRGAPEA